MTDFPVSRTRTHRPFLTRGVSLVTAMAFAIGVAAPVVVAAPDPAPVPVVSQQQNVSWMSAETSVYLSSIGMDVMVPSWLPSPFEGAAPDVYAGEGSYSLYWLGGGDVPTFLHITGVIGAPFPDGSKADLNVPLSINTSVQGWPAIQDIGIPAGSDTPIYDQVWWIANGVRYSVESNNIGTDSLTLANNLVYLEAPAPAPVEEPTVPVATEVPYVPPTEEPVYEAPVIEAPAPTVPDFRVEATDTPLDPAPVTDTAMAEDVVVENVVPAEPVNVPAGNESDTTGLTRNDPWSPSRFDSDVPSDGTSGPRPPVIGGDGTGGLYDTSLPRINIRP